MGFMGHADVSTTLRIYAHVMATDLGERKRLRALVEGVHWAPMGTSGDLGVLRDNPAAIEAKEKP